MAAAAAGPEVRSFVTEVGYPPAGNEVLHRLFAPMREPEPAPRVRTGGRTVSIPSVFDVVAAFFSAGREPEADQATLGPCGRGPEPEPAREVSL